MSLKHSLILCNDNEDYKVQLETFKDKIKNITTTSCSAIQNIVPLFIIEHNIEANFIYPELKINSIEEIEKLKSEPLRDISDSVKEYKPEEEDGFSVNIGKNESDILNNDNPNVLKVLKAEANEERRNLDKINLFRGFFLAFNHQNNIELNVDEEEETSELNFNTMNDNFNEIFDIEI